MTPLVRTATALLALLAAAPAALATTEAEWAAFRADVQAKCLRAGEGLFAKAEATVDPFGSES